MCMRAFLYALLESQLVGSFDDCSIVHVIKNSFRIVNLNFP